ncbi:DNA-binding transcriptional regulator, AcrR family [Nocardioides scoriae]|uniref:DNA-binding transcriptional regulator, AcrR family n=1 Tax=Nocardioides scoriae TaxID=642780 RepID=A0A1H1UZY7_9ACTN|nr:TetR/AcrR family transcriptional regulator [Nocardioides scoriae]SDS77821.1 DNA-binding transcriptional regulator, AcrR family [Nocardioides scoriae]
MSVRPSSEKKLLDAADELLFTRGVAATPVDRVLERAGVSSATLYRAYGSKEGLVAAALERRHRSWLEVWDEVVAEAADDRGRLLAVFEALGRFRSRPDGARWCAFLGTAAEYAAPPPELAAALARESDSLRTRLRELAEPVVGARAETVADALVLLVSGELAMRLRDEHHDATVAREVAAAVLDAPRSTPPRR